MSKKIEYRISSKRSGISVLKSLPQYRVLFYALVHRNIIVRYKKTVLGLFWVFLQPALLTVIFSIFIGSKIGKEVEHYTVFLYAGFTLWSIFSTGFFNGATSLVNQGQLLKKIYFPRLLMPLSHVFSGLFDFCILFVSLILLLVYMGIPIIPVKFILCSLTAMLIALITSSGFSLLISGLTIKSKDLHHAMPFAVQLLLFASPVIYPVQFIESALLQQLLELNPIAIALNLFRAGIYDQAINIMKVLQAVGISLLLLWISFIIFNQQEQTLADHL